MNVDTNEYSWEYKNEYKFWYKNEIMTDVDTDEYVCETNEYICGYK
jgi:hypothetical protein